MAVYPALPDISLNGVEYLFDAIQFNLIDDAPILGHKQTTDGRKGGKATSPPYASHVLSMLSITTSE